LIGADNEQLGILANYEGLRLAREAGLDLVEVAPNVRPPVCRLMDYGKWKYSQKKNVKKHHEQQTKEVRLRPKTDTHDREIKLKQAIKFFKRGDKVQFTMVFRGRERLRREVALEVFRSIVEEFGARVKVERPPSMDGRHMVMIMSAAKDAFDDLDKPAKAGAKAAANAEERPAAPAAPAPSPTQEPPAIPPPSPSEPVAVEPPSVQSAIG
jgi:translation initiation factor IF-3